MTRRDLCRAAALAGCALFGPGTARADRPGIVTIPLGRHVFAVPTDYLHSYSATGLAVAATWPDLAGAMITGGAAIPPKTVLDIGWSLRSSTVADESKRMGWRPWPKDGTETLFGLWRMTPRKRSGEATLFVDDPANPTLLFRYPASAFEPTDNWVSLALDLDDLRATVLFFGAMLPQWREIRAGVTKLYVAFSSPTPPSAP